MDATQMACRIDRLLEYRSDLNEAKSLAYALACAHVGELDTMTFGREAGDRLAMMIGERVERVISELENIWGLGRRAAPLAEDPIPLAFDGWRTEERAGDASTAALGMLVRLKPTRPESFGMLALAALRGLALDYGKPNLPADPAEWRIEHFDVPDDDQSLEACATRALWAIIHGAGLALDAPPVTQH